MYLSNLRFIHFYLCYRYLRRRKTLPHEVYREIAGYQDGVYENGEPRYRQGRFDIFSNYDSMGSPKNKFPTLLIDSSALDEASTRIDEAFKKAYATEIEDFKHEYANQHGAGSVDNLTDADILREVVNTVANWVATSSVWSASRC